MEEIRDKIQGNGWRQGVIIPASPLITNTPNGEAVTEQVWLMAVSQTCDLINPELKKEPYAVFLVLRNIESINGSFTNAHNPRKLHLAAETGELFEANAWEQMTLPREQLTDIQLTTFLTVEELQLRMMLEWLAKRFTRIAFPDTFVETLRPQESKLKKALKSKHSLFTEILIRLDPFTEPKDEEPYDLHCHLLMTPEHYSDENKLKEARLTAAQLEKIFEDAGIEISECSPVSEAKLTVAELKELVRLDFDHLSYRDPPE